MHKGKKKLVFLTLSVYCAGLLLQHFSAFFEVIAKEVNVPHVNIVAVLVDDQLVSPLNNDLQRYATNYIQQEIVDSKALVLPLDLANLDAHDVYTMLENVYFDGLS
ncbi:hypothetical protein J5893_03430 [bacterium]|nr:hypothetical protein [bacterium]